MIINPSGKKTFCLRLQNFRKKLGTVLYDTVQTARKKGSGFIRNIYEEIQMKNQRKDPNLTLLVQALVEEYLEFKKSSLSEKTCKEYRSLFPPLTEVF